MSEKITIRLSFPKFGIEEINFSVDTSKQATSILDYAISQHPDKIPPSSQLFMINEQRSYTYVNLSETIESLGFHANHQVIVMPEMYNLTFKDPNNKSHQIQIRNNYNIQEVLQMICIQNQLLDPKYYVATSGSKELDFQEPITEQVPFADSVSFQLANPKDLFEILIQDFLNSELQCQQKEMYYIMALNLLINTGPYKSSKTTQYEKDIKASIPKDLQNDPAFLKNSLKYVISVYKKMKDSPNNYEDANKYIMSLQHFSSTVLNGERLLSSDNKKTSKDKITASLNYAILRIYKQNTTSLLDQYNICDLQELLLDAKKNIEFSYDVAGKGKLKISLSLGEKTKDLFQLITERLKTPESGLKSSAGAKKETAHSEAITVPPFIIGFGSYNEIPRTELQLTIMRASTILLNTMERPIDEYADSVLTGARDKKELHPLVYCFCSLYTSFDEENQQKFYKKYNEIRQLAQQIQNLTDEAANAQDKADSLKKGSEQKKQLEVVKAHNEEIEKEKEHFKKLIQEFKDEITVLSKNLNEKFTGPSGFPIRNDFKELFRAAVLVLFCTYWLNEIQSSAKIIDKIKSEIKTLLQAIGDINIYSGDRKETTSTLRHLFKSSNSVSQALENIEKTEKDRQYIITIQSEAEQQLKKQIHKFNHYFKKHEQIELIKPMTNEVPEIKPIDPRPLVEESRKLIEKLGGKIDSIKKANVSLLKLQQLFYEILGLAQKSTHQPLINAFNDFKADIELNYATNGMSLQDASSVRCLNALEGVYQSLNPAEELRQSLSLFPPEDPRVVALIPIINYLETNGPLYNGSQSHIDIQKFISQMTTAKTSTLTEFAFKIEAYVPENLRNLASKCDVARDAYKEVDAAFSIEDITTAVKKSADKTTESALNIRKALRKAERESAMKYRKLNLHLWRIMVVFSQFRADESSGSAGHEAFTQCRDAFKVLIEEAAYDMKRDQKFLPFIEEFISNIDSVISDPHDSQSLAKLGGFLLVNQTRPGFYKAAKALASFNHYVLVSDSNKAARELTNESVSEQQFLNTAILIASLRRRLVAILKKVESGMNTKIVRDLRHSDVDLRGDFQTFLKKYTSNIFDIFAQMVLTKTANEEVIRPLSGGIDAIEKLCPFIMSVEIPGPLLGRAVCGIIFSSLELLISFCKQKGGKSEESCNEAFLSVREFLFNIRRKESESEEMHIDSKDGIGIADMYAVIERDKKIINEQADFQGSIRKRKWDSS